MRNFLKHFLTKITLCTISHLKKKSIICKPKVTRKNRLTIIYLKKNALEKF